MKWGAVNKIPGNHKWIAHLHILPKYSQEFVENVNEDVQNSSNQSVWNVLVDIDNNNWKNIKFPSIWGKFDWIGDTNIISFHGKIKRKLLSAFEFDRFFEYPTYGEKGTNLIAHSNRKANGKRLRAHEATHMCNSVAKRNFLWFWFNVYFSIFTCIVGQQLVSIYNNDEWKRRKRKGKEKPSSNRITV